MGTKLFQFFYLWTHFVFIPNYGRKRSFGQAAVENTVQVQIPFYVVWMLDANFGSRWRCSYELMLNDLYHSFDPNRNVRKGSTSRKHERLNPLFPRSQ
jgi:hypothetical protein